MGLFQNNKPPFTEADILARGRQDGINNLPGPDHEGECPFEDELLRAHEHGASLAAEHCLKDLERLDGSIQSYRHAASDGYAADIQQTEDDYKTEVARANNDSILKHAIDDYEEAEQAFKAIYARHNRMPVSYLPHWAYLILAVLIGIGEVPLNALVFNIFGENQVMTWVMSLIIGMTVPLSAHFVGIKVREHGGGFSWPNAAKALVVFAVMAGALFALALMRQDYLGLVGKDIGLSERVIASSFLFYWLNIAVFVAAILISYLAHDSVPGFARCREEKEASQKALRKAQDEQSKRLEAIEQRRSQRMREAMERKMEAAKQVDLLSGEYDSRLKAGQQQEAQWLHRLGQAVASYRGENLRNRRDKATPKCFSNNIGFPLRLAGLPEKTRNDATS